MKTLTIKVLKTIIFLWATMLAVLNLLYGVSLFIRRSTPGIFDVCLFYSVWIPGMIMSIGLVVISLVLPVAVWNEKLHKKLFEL